MKCCDYSAGMLRETVLFEQYALTSDGAGGQTRVWSTVTGAPTRAHMRQLSGGEVWRSDRIEAQDSLIVVVRYSSVIKSTHRLTHDGKRYNITRINDVEFAGKWHEITISGGVAI